jgi:integrase
MPEIGGAGVKNHHLETKSTPPQFFARADFEPSGPFWGQLTAVSAADAQTKGDKSRRIWFNERMRGELAAYVAAHKPKHKTQQLFYTQRTEGFTANTLTHIINSFYQKTGIANASSHSGREVAPQI